MRGICEKTRELRVATLHRTGDRCGARAQRPHYHRAGSRSQRAKFGQAGDRISRRIVFVSPRPSCRMPPIPRDRTTTVPCCDRVACVAPSRKEIRSWRVRILWRVMSDAPQRYSHPEQRKMLGDRITFDGLVRLPARAAVVKRLTKLYTATPPGSLSLAKSTVCPRSSRACAQHLL
jgi:hypothetical protein